MSVKHVVIGVVILAVAYYGYQWYQTNKAGA